MAQKLTFALKSLMLLALLATSGCAAFGRGVVEAVIGGDKIDERLCKIEGASFAGMAEQLSAAQPRIHDDSAGEKQTMRMLIVHGMGPHTEGYSKDLVHAIANGLELEDRERSKKTIELTAPRQTPFGTRDYILKSSLSITRYTNTSKTKELLAFELLWSDHNKDDRERLKKLDDLASRDRAPINDQVKAFFNQQIVEPVRYLGGGRSEIRQHVREAACWMISGDWEDYPGRRQASPPQCPGATEDADVDKIREIVDTDTFVAVTHSLGSRVFLDAFSVLDDGNAGASTNPIELYQSFFRDKDVMLVMLANQLPLLQIGLADEQGVSEQRRILWTNSERYSGYYQGYGAYASQAAVCADPQARLFNNLSIVSVSDPNDLLSYRLNSDFTDEYIDWALCPSFTEVTLAVATRTDVFGVVEFSNPVDAHGDYWTDPGLMQLLMAGFGKDDRNPKFATGPGKRPVAHDDENVKVRYECDGTFEWK